MPSRRHHRLVVFTDSTTRGGAEISLGNLLAHLSGRVRVTAMGVDGEVVDWLVSRRPGTEGVVVAPTASKTDVRAMLALRRQVALRRPDVFHANLTSLWSCQFALLAASTIPHVRCVAVEQLPLAPEGERALALKRFVSGRLAAHVAVGEGAAREVERMAGLPARSVRSIYNGVPEVATVVVPRISSGPVIGAVARFDRQKGLDVLVRAVAAIPEATLVLVGDGAERPALVALAAEVGMSSRLRLVDWTDRARDHLSSFDVFALPSRFEGFPLAIVEAMLAGLPVVATDVGSNTEAVVDQVTGFVVPTDDVAATTTAIARLLADPAERRRMGEAGRSRALARFTAPIMAARFESLYDEITA